jgi:uncharacterized protein YkwD
MHRHRKRHRWRRPGDVSTRVGLPAAVVGTAAAMAVVLGWPGDGGGDSAVAGEALPSTRVVDAPAGAAKARAVVDRGVVRGTLSLRTDVPPHPQTWVAYLIEGPTSIVRFAAQAPYRTDVDTRLLPDGRYTVDEVVFRSRAAPTVTTSRLRIDNRGAARPPARPGAGPARTPSPGSPSPAPSPAPASGSGPTSPAPAPASAPALPTVAPPVPATAPPPSPAPPAGSVQGQVVALTNAERAKAGCRPLAPDPRLTAAAQDHGADMAAGDYFSHESRDGRTPFQRIAAAGFAFSVAAENIAAGQQSPQDVMTGWMNSPGHRANILNCALTHIGVGHATGGSYRAYWVQDFGTP